MAKRKMGAMSTVETVAIVGGGLLLVYLVMSKKTTTALPPATTYVPVSTAQQAINNQYAAQASETNTIANDASSVLNSFINAF